MAQDLRETVHVAVAVVRLRGRVLVGTRRDAPYAGYAEFPGGKCQPGESPECCVVRECSEETGIAVVPLRVLDRVRAEIAGRCVELTFFDCVPAAEATAWPAAEGHFRWVTREELPGLRFPPANERVLRMLMEQPGGMARNV